MSYKIKSFGLSDKGCIRKRNEDFWKEVPDCNFFALADGMGGHSAGDVAAHSAVKILCDIVKQTKEKADSLSFENTVQSLFFAMEEVNRIIWRKSRHHREYQGMGTTLCCMDFHEEGLIYGHVGDSRIYRFRNKKLTQLTKDHSLVEELESLNLLEYMNETHYKNIITKAIGTEPVVDPALNIEEIEDGDIFMMCSDGLSDPLSRVCMEEIMNGASDIEAMGNLLLTEAMEKGGRDNITVVLTKVKTK